MKALLYLTKRSFINNLKKALKKPTTLVVLILGTAYGIFLAVMLAALAAEIRINSVKGLLVILTVWAIYTVLGNFLMYSSRKGVLFRPGHGHFVFTAPISPKLVLIHGAWMNYVFSVIVWILLTIAALTVFQVTWWKAVLFFLAGCVLEITLELCMMIIIYASDRVPERVVRGICLGIKTPPCGHHNSHCPVF